ncbi:MAG TPA: hypothetical protein VKY92_23410 [Verrucomicrobiae bacterium]|nr:hypothetical protein [Verrucomicrobiae bacterium]
MPALSVKHGNSEIDSGILVAAATLGLGPLLQKPNGFSLGSAGLLDDALGVTASG